jgi:alginate O-acetyltransferase complex protein AlgI
MDVYRGKTASEKSYYNYLTYTTLFPQIIAGPVVRYVT